MTSDVELSVTLLHSARHFPGDRVKGHVSVISTISTRITNLRLVWRGVVTTEMDTTRDESTLFREVWYLDPKGANSFVLVPAPVNPRQIKVKKGMKDYSFDLYLKRDIPSSFEMNETVSQVKVEYILEAWADVDGHKTPKRERILVPVLASPHHQETDTEEQQTRDATYIVTIPEVDNREYRTASRITVPCKIAQRGVALPIVAHIWHDRECKRPGGITLSLLRITTISCQHRKETLIREVETTTLDLDLVRRSEYSVQVLSESLRIPPTTLPSLDERVGRLVNIEYRISLKVAVHSNAIYRLTEDEGIAHNMLVDLPLTIDSNDIPELVQPQPLSPTASLRSNSSSGTTSSRMRNLFRRTSNNLSRQTTYVNPRTAITDNLSEINLARQSSSRSSSSPSISSIATDTRPVKPMPPPFTPITEEEERIKRANAKSTPIPEFDTGVYTFQMFEESSDEEYVPINAEQKNPAATSTSTSAAAALPTRSVQNEAPPQTLALSKIPTSSDEGPSGSVQYGGGTDGDRDFDGGEGIRKTNEPRSPTTTASTTTHDLYSTSSTLVSPLSPPPPPARTPVPAPVTVSVPTSTPAASASAAPSSYQDSYHHNQLSVPPLYSDANNAKLDFISESDTDEHSDDSDDEPDLLSVVARREQRIQRQKTRTIPSA